MKFFRNILASLGVAVVGMALLAACGTDTSDLEQQVAALQAQLQQQDEQLQSLQGQLPIAGDQPTIMVKPAFFKYNLDQRILFWKIVSVVLLGFSFALSSSLNLK